MAAATATAAILLTRRVNGRALPKHIDFNPANTVEDAIKYGKEVLGIKAYHDINNLDHINYINEALVYISNAHKGKCRMPSFVVNGSEGLKERNALACMTKDGEKGIKGHVLGINLEFIGKLDELHLSAINKLKKMGLIYKNQSDNSLQLRDIIDKEAKLKLESLLNNKPNSLKDNLALFEGLNEYYDVATQVINGSIKRKITVSPYRSIAHEIGHSQHSHSAGHKYYDKMGKLDEVLHNGLETSVINDFLNSQDKQNIARQVSRYATESPLEFVAEVFANVTCGKKYSNEVMDLYAHYKGPELFV